MGWIGKDKKCTLDMIYIYIYIYLIIYIYLFNYIYTDTQVLSLVNFLSVVHSELDIYRQIQRR